MTEYVCIYVCMCVCTYLHKCKRPGSDMQHYPSLNSPVVHQDVWPPDLVRRNTYTRDVAIFRLVPRQVVIIPLLE